MSKRLLITATCISIIAISWYMAGPGEALYKYLGQVVRNDASIPVEEQVQPIDGNTAILYRVEVIKQEMRELQPLGDGYMLTEFKPNTVHNVPLVIVQQLGWPGILAALAWLWVGLWCLIKTRWKYAWITILALSVFDHYIWTQLAPWWWAVVGASAIVKIENDYIFRGS